MATGEEPLGYRRGGPRAVAAASRLAHPSRLGVLASATPCMVSMQRPRRRLASRSAEIERGRTPWRLPLRSMLRSTELQGRGNTEKSLNVRRSV
jgi:hypothetical protein